MLGCGGSRQLQSVSVMPAAADAQNFPGAQVAFAATGTFNKPPSPQPLTNGEISWCVGKAMAGMNPDGGSQMTVFGAAKLTCP